MFVLFDIDEEEEVGEEVLLVRAMDLLEMMPSGVIVVINVAVVVGGVDDILPNGPLTVPDLVVSWKGLNHVGGMVLPTILVVGIMPVPVPVLTVMKLIVVAVLVVSAVDLGSDGPVSWVFGN